MWARRRPLALWFAVVVVGSLTCLPAVSGQTTDAVCGAKFEWLNNGRGQSPCQVAAVLEKQCLPAADVNIPAVPPGKTYLPPTGELANVCQCNSVLYSLLSACSLCQAGALNSMSSWLAQCPDSLVVGQYPLPVPADTEVPKWAYNDKLKDGFFDLAAAQVIAYQSPAPSATPAWVVPVILSVVLTTLLIAGIAIILIIRRRNLPGKPIDLTAPFRRPPNPSFAPFRAVRRFVTRKDSDYDELVEPQKPPRPMGFMKTVRRVQPRRADTQFDLVATPVETRPMMRQRQQAEAAGASQPSFFASLRRPSERSNFLSLRRPSSPTTPHTDLEPAMTLPHVSTTSLHTEPSRSGHGPSESTTSLASIPPVPSTSHAHAPTPVPVANTSSSFLPISVPSIPSIPSLFSKGPKAVISTPPRREFDIAAGEDSGAGSDGEVIAREFGSFSMGGDDAATVVLDIGSEDEGSAGRRRKERKTGRRSSTKVHMASPIDETFEPPLPSSRLMSAANTPLPSSSGHFTRPSVPSSSSVAAPPIPAIPAHLSGSTLASASAFYSFSPTAPASIIPGPPLPRTSTDTIGLSPATLAAPKPPHWEKSRSDIVNEGVERGVVFDPRGIKLWKDQQERRHPSATRRVEQPQQQQQLVKEGGGGGRVAEVRMGDSRPRYGSADDGIPGRPSHDLDPSYPGVGPGFPASGGADAARLLSPAPSSSSAHGSGSRSPSSHGSPTGGSGSGSGGGGPRQPSSRTSPNTSPSAPMTKPMPSPSSSSKAPLLPPPSTALTSPPQSFAPKSATSRSPPSAFSPPASSSSPAAPPPTSRLGSLRGPRSQPPPSPRNSLSHSHSRSGSETVGRSGSGSSSAGGHSRVLGGSSLSSNHLRMGSGTAPQGSGSGRMPGSSTSYYNHTVAAAAASAPHHDRMFSSSSRTGLLGGES